MPSRTSNVDAEAAAKVPRRVKGQNPFAGIRLYVNEYSEDVGEGGIAAVEGLFARAASANLIPAGVRPEFV